MRAVLGLMLVVLVACGRDEGASASVPSPPILDTSEMEPLVREMLDARRAAVLDLPSDASAWTALGLALDAHFFLEEAEACLEVATDLDPDRFDAAYDHAVLGTLLPRSAEDVVVRFARAAALRPDYPPTYARLGDFLQASGDPAAAADAFREALAIAAGYDYASLGLGRALMDGDDLSGAIAVLEPVHARHPGDPAVATALAQTLTLDGRGEEAAAITVRQESAPDDRVRLGDAVRREVMALSRSAAMNFQRGESKLRGGDLVGAVTEFERVLSVDANNRRARLYLARTLVGLRRLTDARAQLAMALERDRRDPDAHALLGQLDAEAGAFESALEHFDTASRAGRLDDLSFRAWTTALGGLSRWDEVLFRLDEWSAGSPDHPELEYMRAMALFNVGRQDEARDALRGAVAAHPESPLRAQVERMLGN